MTDARRAILITATMLAAVWAGCLGSSGGAGGPQGPGFNADEAVILQGQVLDQELVPVAGVHVVMAEADHENTTAADGAFSLGPLMPGQYTIVAQKAGYAPGEVQVTVPDGGLKDPVIIFLTPVAADVPYHFSESFVTFVYCASYNPIGGVPCTKLIDYAAGTNISPEENFAYPFEIRDEGLVDMLVELTWEQQQFGKDMLYMIQTPPGQPLTAGTTKYFSKSGGGPLRGWVVGGVANMCGSAECAGVFDVTPGNLTYEALTVWSGNNGTVPGVPGVLSGTSVYLNHRAEAWHTFFHNRAGTRTFSALPDE